MANPASPLGTKQNSPTLDAGTNASIRHTPRSPIGVSIELFAAPNAGRHGKSQPSADLKKPMATIYVISRDKDIKKHILDSVCPLVQGHFEVVFQGAKPPGIFEIRQDEFAGSLPGKTEFVIYLISSTQTKLIGELIEKHASLNAEQRETISKQMADEFRSPQSALDGGTMHVVYGGGNGPEKVVYERVGFVKTDPLKKLYQDGYKFDALEEMSRTISHEVGHMMGADDSKVEGDIMLGKHFLSVGHNSTSEFVGKSLDKIRSYFAVP